ncbi:MAG: DUF368 domain-containing protein [Clostridiales bacterium]|nr:DUF368 domain-containing protein [Clostridiales bacterium]
MNENKQPAQGSESWQERLLGILKGALISIGALLPGISGGALCVILGIYKRIMALLCHPIQEIKKQWKFFIFIGIGFVIGVLLGAKVIDKFLEANEAAALFLFIGLIVGSMPGLFKEARQQGVKKGSYAALVIALVIMLAWMIPMSLMGNTNVQPSLLWWVICGVLWGLGIVVPGMSPSNIIFFFGLQAPMYAAIGNLDLSVILPMGLALLATVLGLSKGIDYCLKKQYSIFMHAVIGIVIASTIVILPPVKVLIEPGYTFATGLSDLMIYAACFLLGAVAAWALSRIQKEEA